MQWYVAYGGTGSSHCFEGTLHLFTMVYSVRELQYKAVTTRLRLHAQLYICCHNSTLTIFSSVLNLTLRHNKDTC